MQKFKLLFLFTIATLACVAQKPFEGRIVYKISYEDVPVEMQGLDRMLPGELIMIVKGTTTRVEQNSAFGGNQVFLNWAEKDSSIVLVDVLGQKMRYQLAKDERKWTRYSVTETDETKEIKGYMCKKALLETSKGTTTLEVWYTDQFVNPAGSEFPQLRGIPMQYEVRKKGVTMKFKVHSIKEEAIDETYFAVPDEYVETSLEIFNEMIRDY